MVKSHLLSKGNYSEILLSDRNRRTMWRMWLSGPTLAAAWFPRELSAVEALNLRAVHRRWGSSVKMTKQLKKMFDRRAGSKKKKIFPGPVNVGLVQDVDLNPRRKQVYTEGQKRRAHQVGKVLYDNIVHLINSGALSDELASLCVEIVRVKVVPDFSVVKVYWLGSGTEEDQTMQILLNGCAGRLRQLLTSFHVLGTIPRICFVRDDSQACYLEVESLLRSADFGPDFVPTQLDSTIRSITWARHTESSSPDDSLQGQFNALEMAAISSGLDPEQATPSTQKKPDFEGEFDEKTKQENSDRGRTSISCSSNGTSAPFKVESESAHIQHCQQDWALRTSPSQPSSLEVEQLGSQYLSTDHESANTMPKPSTSAMLEEKLASLSKDFRDNLYYVPHSDLLNKILVKKQKAGVRPSMRVDLQAQEPAIPEESTSLKSVLKKKVRSKQRPKMQSDYFEADFVEMNSGDAYEDEDHYRESYDDLDDGEITDDLSSRE